MIKIQYSLVVAQKILDLIMADERAKELDAMVECYQNGREQGYLIWNWKVNKAFYIAQQRNSDSIVVYLGSYKMQSISEDAHRSGKYFDCGDYVGAVDYIFDTLLSLQILETLTLGENYECSKLCL